MESTEGLQARFIYQTIMYSDRLSLIVKVVEGKISINESSSRVSFAAETKIEETSEWRIWYHTNMNHMIWILYGLQGFEIYDIVLNTW